MTHKDILFKILDILDANKIPYFFFCGTLLGAIRDRNFLATDVKDTDIAVDEEHYWKLRYIFDKEFKNSSTFRYYFIWRKEISITNEALDAKIDIFFLEHKEDKYLMYSYKPNPENKRWDYEWRASFTYDNFYPLETIKFLGRKVNIPAKSHAILTEQYGDWTIPNPSWISSDKTLRNVDESYSGFYPGGIYGNDYSSLKNETNVGFICINFLRTDCTKTCILSIKQYYPNVKIYVADQDLPSGDMISFYERNNVEYYYLPYDCGLSYCRNFLLEKVKEPYLMWGDNDFVFNENSNIEHGLKILNSSNDIGFVGGGVIVNNKLQHYERILSYVRQHNILVYIPLELTNPEKHIVDDIEFYYCDLTFNYVICKTKILQNNKSLRWNPDLKVAYEHTSMFLCLNQFNTFKIVYCPSMSVIHAHSFKNSEYNTLRKRKNAGLVFSKIWDLKMNFTVGQGREVYAESCFTPDAALSKQVYTIELPQMELAELNKRTKTEISTLSKKERIEKLFKIIAEKNILTWLLKDSCFDCVKYQDLTLHKLTLGVKDEAVIYQIQNINAQENLFLEIEYTMEHRTIKIFSMNNMIVNVPSPVIKYLESEYKKSFKELIKKDNE